MAYVKNKLAPLMFSGPTPTNMAPAMAGYGRFGADEIEMDPDYVGKGANPNIVGQAPPVDIGASVKAFADSVRGIFGMSSSPTPQTKTVGSVARPLPTSMPSATGKLLAAGPLLLLIGGVAYFALKKRS